MRRSRPNRSNRPPSNRRPRHRQVRRKRNSTSPKWWNWQTHHLEGVAPRGMRVRVPPSASQNQQLKPGSKRSEESSCAKSEQAATNRDHASNGDESKVIAESP